MNPVTGIAVSIVRARADLGWLAPMFGLAAMHYHKAMQGGASLIPRPSLFFFLLQKQRGRPGYEAKGEGGCAPSCVKHRSSECF